MSTPALTPYESTVLRAMRGAPAWWPSDKFTAGNVAALLEDESYPKPTNLDAVRRSLAGLRRKGAVERLRDSYRLVR